MTDTPTFDAVARDTLPARVETPTHDPLPPARVETSTSAGPPPWRADTPTYDALAPSRADTPTVDALAHTRDAQDRGDPRCPEQREGADILAMGPVSFGRHRKASPFAVASP